MPVFNFRDNDGIDIGNKYVTKEYLMDVYPDLVPGYASPELYTWGKGDVGQLGYGSTTPRSSPGTTAGSSATWKQISISKGDGLGYIAAGGVKSDGTLWTWGLNQVYGALGDGTTSPAIKSSPGTTAGGGTNWKQVSMGKFVSAAVKTDGTLWTWGNGSFGGLGDGTNNNRSSPGTTAGGGTNWKQVSAGFRMMAAVKTDGTLWTWGFNSGSIVGSGNTFDTYGGALGAGSFAATYGRSSPGTTSGGGTNWKSVSVASTRQNTESNAVAAIKTDGTLWTWGNNEARNLGDGTQNRRSSPGTTAGGGTTWKDVSLGGYGCGAIKTDGTLWMWGLNSFGDVGDGTVTARASPVTTVGGGTNWKSVSVGGYVSAGIKTDGTLWTWGAGSYGGLGDGTTTSRRSPGTTVGGGTNWKSVEGGYYAAFAIAEQGNW
jgi:alpha-tubulin suppressor-like RCC1 family protein